MDDKMNKLNNCKRCGKEPNISITVVKDKGSGICIQCPVDDVKKLGMKLSSLSKFLLEIEPAIENWNAKNKSKK